MAWELLFVSSNLLNPTTYVPLVGYFEITFKMYKATGTGATKLCDSSSGVERLDINISAAGTIDARTYCHFEVDGVPATSIPYDVWFDFTVIRDGSDADQAAKRFGKIGARYNNANTSQWNLQTIAIDVAGSPVAFFDATSSVHGDTGSQPVLVDTVGSYDATGINFPTNGDAWNDLGGANPIGTIAYTTAGLTTVISGNIGESATGTIAPTMAGYSVAITGSVGDNPTGTIAVTMSGLTTTMGGNVGEAVNGAISSTMSGYTVSIAGNIGEAITGTIATTMSGLTMSASGTVATPAIGTIAYTMQGMTVKASESTGGDRIYGAIAIEPIAIEQINVIPIVVITK